MRRRIWVLVAVVTLVATACSSGGHHQATPTTTDPATTLPAGPNPDVIPAHITPAYVNAVFVQLDLLWGDATRLLVKQKAVSANVEQDLRAVFAAPVYETQLSQAQASLDGPIDNVRPNPGNASTVVLSLLTATPNCIFASTRTSLMQVLIRPSEPAASEYYELIRKTPTEDPLHLNPTPWVIGFNAAYLTPTKVATKCSA